MWRYEVFAGKLTWYFTGVYIINHFIGSDVILSDYIFQVTGSDVILLDRTRSHNYGSWSDVILSDYISCHWIGRHVIGSETSFDRASGLFEKKFISQSASPDTYQQIWRLTCRVDIEHGLYKLDWLCSLVLRLRWTFEEALLPNLCQAHDLISLTIIHNEESADVQKNRPMIVTCNVICIHQSKSAWVFLTERF